MRKSQDFCYYHLIWRTYLALPLIDNQCQRLLWGFWKKQIRELKCDLIAVAIATDHIHLLLQIPPVRSVSDIIHYLKGSSAHWLNQIIPAKKFRWQKGYAVYTVSRSVVPKVKDYIVNHVERADKGR